jgi:hypothetical protein
MRRADGHATTDTHRTHAVQHPTGAKNYTNPHQTFNEARACGAKETAQSVQPPPGRGTNHTKRKIRKALFPQVHDAKAHATHEDVEASLSARRQPDLVDRIELVKKRRAEEAAN